MPPLPAHPNLDHLRRQAKDLLRMARAGDADTLRRLGTGDARPTLTAARLTIAREYGFASWPRLKAEVESRTLDLAEQATAFVRASVGDSKGRAARMLAANPALATYDFSTAVVLGDASRVGAELERDPGLATRRDPASGWTALHLACSSRWHTLDPASAHGLAAVARLLLNAGATVDALTSGMPRRGGGRTALRCATATASAGAGNEPLLRLLLERGAPVGDHDLYLVAFGHDDHRCLRLLLGHTPDPAATIAMAFAAPISLDDDGAVRLLLEAGGDPRAYRDDDDRPAPAVYEAVVAGCGATLVGLLLEHGADPNGTSDQGRSAYQAATAAGRGDLLELLARHGAAEDASPADRLRFACLRDDRPAVERELAGSPELERSLADVLRPAVERAAETGNTAAIALALDLGVPADGAIGEAGEMALHLAAYAGSAGAVRLLLDRGAAIDALDPNWDSTPLGWAIVGSGERPRHDPSADWVATVRALLDAGASTDGITLSPDDPTPPSPEIASLLRRHGVDGDEPSG
jgi:ankyrin repeat protein